MLNNRAFLNKLSYIRKLPDGKWRVYSEKGKNMGTYNTEAEAKERLRQIEYFKHKKAQTYTSREQEDIVRSRDPYSSGDDVGVSHTFPSETSQSIPERYEGEFTALVPERDKDKAITPYTASPADLLSAPMNTIREGTFKYNEKKNLLQGEIYWDKGDFKDDAEDEVIFKKLANWLFNKFKGLRDLNIDDFTNIYLDKMVAYYTIEGAFMTPLAKDQIRGEK